MNKTLKRDIFGLAACVCMVWSPTCLGYKWITHENNKSHVFCHKNGDGTQTQIVDISKGWVLDEGFRWKTSLNFTIPDSRIKDSKTEEVFDSDQVHQELCRQVRKAGEGHGCAGALTIVRKLRDQATVDAIDNNRYQYEACTYYLADRVSMPLQGKKEDYISAAGERGVEPFSYENAQLFLKRITNLVGHEEKDYSCCEGQMLGRLIAGEGIEKSGYLESVLENHVGDDVVLVVLHLHSEFDPCGKCSRLISSVSDWLNKHGPDTINNRLGLDTESQELEALKSWCNDTETRDANFCYHVAFKSHKTDTDPATTIICCEYPNNITRHKAKDLKTVAKQISLPRNLPNEQYDSLVKWSAEILTDVDDSNEKTTETEFSRLKLAYMIKLYTIIFNATDLSSDLKIDFCNYIYNRIRTCFKFNYKTLIEVSCNQIYAIKKDMRPRLQYCLKECSPQTLAMYEAVFGTDAVNQSTVKNLTSEVELICNNKISLPDFIINMTYKIKELKEPKINKNNVKTAKSARFACLCRAYRVLNASEAIKKVKKEWLEETCGCLKGWIVNVLNDVDDNTTVSSWTRRVNAHCRGCGTGSENIPITVKLDDDEKINSEDHPNNANSVTLGFKKQPAQTDSQSKPTPLIFEKSYPPYAVYSVIGTSDSSNDGEYWPAEGTESLEKF